MPDDEPTDERPLRAGDVVDITTSFGVERVTLTQRDADDLNAGENPMYPYRLLGIALVQAAD